MHLRPLLILAALALPGVVLAAGQAYQWTDASGVVHFSEERPPAGTEYSVIDIRTGTTRRISPREETADGDAGGESAERDAPRPAAATPQPEEVADTAENRTELCTRLADNIRVLESEQVAVLGDHVLSDEERGAQLAAAREQQAGFCADN